MQTAGINRGVITPSKCNKCSSSIVISAPQEGVDNATEVAGITVVETVEWDSITLNTVTAKMVPIKGVNGGILNNTRIKEVNGKETKAKCSSQCSKVTRDMEISETMEDVARDKIKGEATTSGR